MILFVNACVREEESRTKSLARTLLEELEGEIEVLDLAATELPCLDREMLGKRDAACRNGEYSDNYFEYAKQFARADCIVIAAPHWDLSFPAILKQYIETITVTGITFRYSEQGIPEGLCRAKRLFFVTTSGGPVFTWEFGYGYIKALATQMYGIGECVLIDAQGLDIFGNDAETILEECRARIRSAGYGWK